MGFGFGKETLWRRYFPSRYQTSEFPTELPTHKSGSRVSGYGFRVWGSHALEKVLPESRPIHEIFFFFFITLGLELSDTKVYEP